jgi:hypothetical protein
MDDSIGPFINVVCRHAGEIPLQWYAFRVRVRVRVGVGVGVGVKV